MTWAEQLAASAGVPVDVISALGEWLEEGLATGLASVCEWRDAVFKWLGGRPELIPALLRPEALEGLLGKRWRELEDESARGRLALPVLERLSREWMAGSTLAKMEVFV